MPGQGQGAWQYLLSCTLNVKSVSKATSKPLFRTITNHPVHIEDKDGNLSPTALIPFCEFGGNMSVMGVKIDLFDVPVCNSFRPKIVQDQLCYTVDPDQGRICNEYNI